MISCTEFIPAYSELFRFLEKKGGYGEVMGLWEFLSDHYLKRSLKALVRKHGIRGCWMYWSKSLNEEAADFTMELDEQAGEFVIKMHHCPSRGLLNRLKHYKQYPRYCEHCDVLYRRVLEPLGFECESDMTRCGQAACGFVVRIKKSGMNGKNTSEKLRAKSPVSRHHRARH